MGKNESEYLKTAKVAKDLNLSQRSICRLCESGELPAIKLKNQWLICAKKYYAFIEAKKNAAIEQFLLTIDAKNNKE